MSGIYNRISLQLVKSTPGQVLHKKNLFDPVEALCNHLSIIQIRSYGKPNYPKLRYPLWFLRKERAKWDEQLTGDNQSFIKDMVHEKFGPPAIIHGYPTFQTSPLKNAPIQKGEWTPKSRRCGLLARKIGCYPMWEKDGSIIHSTLLQVTDNHVIKYTPPEEVDNSRRTTKFLRPNKFGSLLVGAESADPQRYTKEYCGLFTHAGLPPKRILGKFQITPNAALQPGTPLFATHFKPGDYIDVTGKTIDRGFQGVMKRWGFKGMPASHGVTKTHRKGGNVGGGGEKGRIWPGTKMPGHMGNRWRTIPGLKIWRINTKFNVIYVNGLCVPGETGAYVYIYDTLLPTKRRTEAPYFPTYDGGEDLAEDLYDKDVQPFDAPSITYEESK